MQNLYDINKSIIYFLIVVRQILSTWLSTISFLIYQLILKDHSVILTLFCLKLRFLFIVIYLQKSEAIQTEALKNGF